MNYINVPLLDKMSEYDNIQEIRNALDKQKKEIIGNAPWPEFSYIPDVSFTIAHAPGYIFLKYDVFEQEVMSIFSMSNDPVYRDSCVEFFICFADDKNYYNLEFNSLGTCLMGYGPDRDHRNLLPEELIGKIQTTSRIIKNENTDNKLGWQLTLIIPLEVFCFQKISQLQGKSANANFYKCGDDLAVPHFLAWNNINTPQPNFHQPDFFGKLIFE